MIIRSRAGFSLIEAIVVVSITVVLTTIFIFYSHKTQEQVLFFREQSLLVSSLLRVKGFAIETFQPELNPGIAPQTGGKRVCGWGMHFVDSSNGFLIYTDLAQGGPDCLANANQAYTPGVGVGEKFEDFAFDPSIVIKCFDVNPAPNQPCASPGTNRMDITFVPPEPTVVFKPAGAEAVIVLGFSDPTQLRTTTIRVNSFGQISVD